MIGAVKKALLLFLLICLPLQFVWAGAASYCAHEQGDAVSHFGHHSHQHATESASHDDQGALDKSKSAAAADADCGYCHLSCQASFLMAPPQVPVLQESLADSALISPFSSRIPDRLLRPDWRLVS